ncbi:MAG: winged helix-turn-helix domain-containing protein, partial [Halobacteriaceae archaeon]
MANATDPGNRSSLSPDEAFAVLGNETRVSILQTLGGEDDPLTFTELRNRVGIRQGSQFNYHLDKLVGHFVRKTDEGYTLRQAGTRVVEAVLSGAVTETVVIEPTRLDAPCPYCGADIEISYREERLLVRCTDCVGSFGSKESTSKSIGTVPPQTLTLSYLPSAGVSGRSPQDILDFSPGLSRVETITMANGNCPRCAGSVDQSIEVCDDHRPNGAICGNCNTRFAVIYDYRCTNCNHRKRGGFSHHL